MYSNMPVWHLNSWDSRNRQDSSRFATHVVDQDGHLAQTLWDNLLGIVYLRNYGNDYEYDRMQELSAHWRSLGVDVPMFAMDAEDSDDFSISAWHFDRTVDLEQAPFNLVYVAPER